MTAEICMMNRLAVVLAADSATTVSRWMDGKKEERYFKGANKVFQLSTMHPVGLMIFDSADVLSVPWEVIIKSFRAFLEKKSFNTVEDYAKELLAYLNDNQRFFPDEIQNDQFIGTVQGFACGMIAGAIHGVDEAERLSAINDAFARCEAALVDIVVSDCIGDEHAQKIALEAVQPVSEDIAAFLDHVGIARTNEIDQWAQIAIWEVIKNPEKYLNTTGLVFAGFGDHEYFPSMVEYGYCGVIGGRHIFKRQSAEKIDHDTPAWISAFAQTSMTDTFSLGLSADVYGSLMVAVVDTIENFADEVAAKSGGKIDAIDDLSSLVQAARNKISDAVLDKARREHSLPLRSVLSVLPVDEMAELAETLITLQSLKEKVTKPSETVGGPVDVAIITKHEGLVWVKRKHFFNSDINTRFQLRQAATH